MKILSRRIVITQIVGFICIIILLWLDELLDLPHVLFGASPTPINWIESVFESIIVLFFGFLCMLASRMFLKRIHYLEGFLRVCCFCKKVYFNGNWIPIEKFITDHSEAVFSHGFCPECQEKHYGPLAKETD